MTNKEIDRDKCRSACQHCAQSMLAFLFICRLQATAPIRAICCYQKLMDSVVRNQSTKLSFSQTIGRVTSNLIRSTNTRKGHAEIVTLLLSCNILNTLDKFLDNPGKFWCSQDVYYN